MNQHPYYIHTTPSNGCFGIRVTNPKMHYTLTDGTSLVFKPVVESSRTYHYPDGSTYRVEKANYLCVRETSHRLMTSDGRKIIVRGGFNAIVIDALEWTA